MTYKTIHVEPDSEEFFSLKALLYVVMLFKPGRNPRTESKCLRHMRHGNQYGRACKKHSAYDLGE